MPENELTQGPVIRSLLVFSLPMIAGSLLQQLYSIADTMIVGRCLGADALAAVGSSYSLMTFLTSLILGLNLGSAVLCSIHFAQHRFDLLKQDMLHAFVMCFGICLLLNLLCYLFLPQILLLLQVPPEVRAPMRAYLFWIFSGLTGVFLYNFFASVLRALSISSVPLYFLALSAVLNIGLDLLLILVIPLGTAGAAIATVISQYVSGIGLCLYFRHRFPQLRLHQDELHLSRDVFKQLASLSILTALQQSVMNFGILLVQGRVNSFGPSVMAAFSAAVKIDSFAYMPVQEFGTAFSTFVAQNYGAGQYQRIRQGTRSAVLAVFGFCLLLSALIFVFAGPLMELFVSASSTEIIQTGIDYLRIEGSFYFGIGLLFLLYGYYRAMQKPGMSLILTILSLGTRVVLAYSLSALPAIGVTGIWLSVPVGWALADLFGVFWYFFHPNKPIPVPEYSH